MGDLHAILRNFWKTKLRQFVKKTPWIPVNFDAAGLQQKGILPKVVDFSLMSFSAQMQAVPGRQRLTTTDWSFVGGGVSGGNGWGGVNKNAHKKDDVWGANIFPY